MPAWRTLNSTRNNNQNVARSRRKQRLREGLAVTGSYRPGGTWAVLSSKRISNDSDSQPPEFLPAAASANPTLAAPDKSAVHFRSSAVRLVVRETEFLLNRDALRITYYVNISTVVVNALTVRGQCSR